MPLQLPGQAGRWLLTLALAWLSAGAAQALEIRFERVAPGVWAHIGDKGGRSYDNEGLNANIGLVETPAGAVLIDAGATLQSARKIHEAVRRTSTQPLRWVINTGGQDHRWLGNGYFIQQGVEVIAHANARADMLARGGDHLAALRPVLREKLDGTVPTLPTRFVAGADETLTLGGVAFELRHRGGGHTPGDMMVWLPAQQVLFSGDIVYVERLLGVIPVSHTGRWLEAFAVIEALRPPVIVPGHGRVTDLASARADTQDYLLALRAHMRAATQAMTDISEAVQSFDAAPFMRLLNAAELMPGNASRTYLELERE